MATWLAVALLAGLCCAVVGSVALHNAPEKTLRWRISALLVAVGYPAVIITGFITLGGSILHG